MSQLDEMRIYAEVVKRGNFTVAAHQLGISKQLVSRRVMDLEQRLGARLLNRTTRKLSPTELGKVFFERCLEILLQVTEAEQEVSSSSGELRGLLRLSVPVSFASMVLSPALNSFMLQHPKLEVALDVDNRLVDVVGEGYDMVIRITKHPDEGMVARKLADSSLIYCCSPSYIARYGMPELPMQLGMHQCITSRAGEWVFEQDGETLKIQVHPTLRSNHGEVMCEAAIAGLGITGLPEFYVRKALKSGQLVAVLQEFTGSIGAIYALYPQHRQSSLMVRTFADFLQDWFKQEERA
ncbi:LysR family transcriptional regulator [Methylobacillus gramineus]|uniref:LysR family transcriptional regulator n=1 Tax=Methylobacillus gramineus TaxID=755169 RepID=UPI001D000F48|nr:LysR family transcriptional regulator [Methylobacillus gramineus]MCB5185822.1 LysR family transcriptional regulator [Methylobacillus gramineus]